MSRNPMYVAVLIVLVGQAIAFDSVMLWVYAVIVAVAFHLRVVRYEEPWLERQHRGEWLAYRARVPRWVGRHATGWGVTTSSASTRRR